MADCIVIKPSGFDTGAVTATASDVLSGKIIVDKNGNAITGTMANNGNKTVSWCGFETISVIPHPQDPKTQALVTIPNAYNHPGYYNNGSAITGNIGNLIAANIKAGVRIGRATANGANDTNSIKGTFTSDANAVAGNILSGKTAYVNGSKLTGTMPYRVNVQTTPGYGWNDTVNSNAYIRILDGCYIKYDNGDYPVVCVPYATLAAGVGLTAGKLLKGQTVLGVAGTATSDATATTGDILTGKTAYINGSKITGTMATLAGGTYTPKATQQTISCSGKKMTSNIIIAGDADLVAANIASGKNIFGVAGSARILKTYRVAMQTNYGRKTIYDGDSGSGHSCYWISISNIGFTPVYAGIEGAGKYFITTAADGSGNGNGYFPKSKNPDISMTSTLVRLPIPFLTTSADIWGFVVGY